MGWQVVTLKLAIITVCWVTEPAPIRGEWPLQYLQTLFHCCLVEAICCNRYVGCDAFKHMFCTGSTGSAALLRLRIYFLFTEVDLKRDLLKAALQHD